jgi:hypothetical protein
MNEARGAAGLVDYPCEGMDELTTSCFRELE